MHLTVNIPLSAALFLKHCVSDKMAIANEMEPTLKMQKTPIKSNGLECFAYDEETTVVDDKRLVSGSTNASFSRFPKNACLKWKGKTG